MKKRFEAYRLNWTVRPLLNLLFLTSLLCGCGLLQKQTGDPHLTAFLTNSGVDQEEVYERLGEPAESLQNDQIYTYRLRRDKRGFNLVPTDKGWDPVTHSLVVLFDDKGRLTEHHVVNILGD